MFFNDCQCQANMESNLRVNDCPKFYISSECFVTLEHFIKLYDEQISYLYESNGDFEKYAKVVSSNVDLLCALRETSFNTNFSKTFTISNSILFVKNNINIAEINFISDKMRLTKRSGQKLPIIFSMKFKDLQWYFCDFFCYGETRDGRQYCLYLN